MKFFFVFFVFWFLYLHFWPNFIGRVFEAELHLPEDHLEEGHLVWDFFFVFSNFFGFERKTFEILTTTVPQCCQNCTLCARGTNWEKNNFESKKKYRRWQFSDFNAECFGVSVGLSISFVRFSFYVSKQILWIKIHLFNSFF